MPRGPAPWLFAVFLLLAAVGSVSTDLCSLIEGGQLFDLWKNCTYTPGLPFGNVKQFLTLDFSAVPEAELNGFFAKATDTAEICGGIRIVGNDNLTTLKIGNIAKLWSNDMPENSLLVEIAHNPILVNIEWKLKTIDVKGKPYKVLFYNNSMLNIDPAMTAILKANATKESYVDELGECRFNDPFNPDNTYTYPSQEQLNRCKTIKGGDLKLKNLTIPGDLHMVDSGCIQLDNMDLRPGKLTFGGKLLATCKDGTKSLFSPTRNKGLCRETLANIVENIVGRVLVNDTDLLGPECVGTCTAAQALSPHYRCREITEDADISEWFTKPELKWQAAKLELANVTLTIANIQNLESISLPALKDVHHLVLLNNTKLEVLDVPNLSHLGAVDSHNNPLNMATMFKLYSVADRKTPMVDCYTTATTIHRNVTELSLCRRVIGPLILKDVGTISKKDFTIEEINGCVTIEDTELDNLQFLENVKIHNCTGQHVLHNNPQLCPHEFLDSFREAPAHLSGRYRTDEKACTKICTHLRGPRKCVKYYGDLVVTDDYSPYKIMDMESIIGQLIIHDTKLERLDFPKLELILGTKAPLLQISNNTKLKTLRMPLFPNIKEHSSVRPSRVIVVEGNPHLTAEQFLQANMVRACSQNREKRCYYDKSTNFEVVKEHDIWFYVEPILTLVLVVLAHFLICLPTWWLRRGKEDYEAEQQEEWTKAAEMAAAGNDSNYREMMKKNRNGRPSGVLRVDKTQSEEDEEPLLHGEKKTGSVDEKQPEPKKKKKVYFQPPETPRKAKPSTRPATSARPAKPPRKETTATQPETPKKAKTPPAEGAAEAPEKPPIPEGISTPKTPPVEGPTAAAAEPVASTPQM